jgi:DNA-binding FadR family transcriptional regulator
LHQDFGQSWLKDHEDLLEVLVRRKPGPALKLVEDHIEGPYQRVLQANRDPSAL